MRALLRGGGSGACISDVPLQATKFSVDRTRSGDLGEALPARCDRLRNRTRHLGPHCLAADRRRGRTHALHHNGGSLYVGGRRTNVWPASNFSFDGSSGLRTFDRCADVYRRILSLRSCSLEYCFLYLNPTSHIQSPAHLLERMDRERTRGGPCRPIRYRVEQHAARAVHVPCRWAACGDEPSFQRDDEPVG